MGVRELAEYLIKSLADRPEEVVLEEHEEDDTIVLDLKIAPEDLGKIIGKSGNTINAIRTVLQTAASSHKKRARLEVATPAQPVEAVEDTPGE